MRSNNPAGGITQVPAWPGFVDISVLHTLLSGLHLRGYGVLVVIDLTRRTIDADGVIHRLDVAELLTVETLAARRGTVVTRSELAEVLTATKRVGVRRVDAVVGQLRSKLGKHSDAIAAHYGRGYSLRDGEDIEVRSFAP